MAQPRLAPDEPIGSVESDDLGECPQWLIAVVFVAAGAVLGFGGVGLLLADLGDYTLGRVLPFGILGALLALGISLRAWRATRVARQDQWAAAGMGVVALALAAWNGRYAAHHILANNDPGLYTITGKWIAAHGTLIVTTSPTWTATGAAVTSKSGGMYVEPGATLQFQFAHLLPTLLAGADGIGGDALMFRVPAVLGSLGLCAVYCFGRRMVRNPWLLLAAVTGLGLSLPQLQVSRDTFSESCSQFLLWTALLALVLALDRRTTRGRYGLALLAGAALGGTAMAHIDAPGFFVLVPLLAAFGWLNAGPDSRRTLLTSYGCFVVGAVPPLILGTLDVQRRAGRYYADLHTEVHSLYAAIAAIAVVSVGLLVVWPLAPRLRSWSQRHRGPVGASASSLTVAVLIFAWAWRPALLPVHSAANTVVKLLQQQEGLPIDPTRTYYEQSMVWMSWYLGPVALALAIAGLGVLVGRLVAAPTPPIVIALGITGSLTAVYLYAAENSSYQLWVTRRFVTASMPLLAIAAAVGLGWLGQHLVGVLRQPRYRRSIVVAAAAGLIAFPLGTTWPVRHMSTEAGLLVAVQDLCHRVGPHAAVLYLSQAAGGQNLNQTTMAFCGVPSASLAAPATPAELQALAAAWQREGRTLWLVGNVAAGLTAAEPGTTPIRLIAATADRDVTHTLVTAPTTYTPVDVVLYGVVVAP